MSRAILFCAVPICLRLLCADAQGQESRNLKALFLAQAPAAWEEFHGRARRLQGSCCAKLIYGTGEVAGHTKSDIKQAEGFALSLEQSLLPKGKDGTGKLRATNPKYGFELRRADETSGWTVLKVDLPSAGRHSSDDLFHDVEFWVNAPITFTSVSGSMPEEKKGFWPTMIKSRGFSLKTVVAEKLWAKVQFQYQPNGKSKRVPSLVAGWALLDPERLWSIQEYTIQLDWAHGTKIKYTAKYQYEESRDRLPVLKRIDIAFNHVPDKSKKFEVSYQFDLREADVPAEEFTLSKFGFPEPMGVTWPKPTRWWLWISLAAVGIAVLGVTWLKIYRRYRPAEPVKQPAK